MWSQRDLETSISSLVSDIRDHIKLVKDSTGDPCEDIEKLCAHVRYDLMTLAKRIESKIEDSR